MNYCAHYCVVYRISVVNHFLMSYISFDYKTTFCELAYLLLNGIYITQNKLDINAVGRGHKKS